MKPAPLALAILLALAALIAALRWRGAPPDRSASSPAAAPAAPAAPAAAAAAADPVRAFTDWLADFRAAPAAARKDLLSAGVVLAQSRRAALLALIQTDPAAALAAALPAETLSALPPEIAALSERRIDQPAFYGVLAICGEEGPAHSHGATCRIEREVRLGGLTDPVRYIVHTFGTGLDRQTEESGRVVGILLDDQIAVAPPAP